MKGRVMDFKTINEYYIELCRCHGANLRIETISDPAAPRWELTEGEEHSLRMNTLLIPQERYQRITAYHVMQFLLPRLMLETSRLLLRRFQMEDAQDCFAFLSDQQGTYLDCCQPFTAMDEAYRDRIALFVEREGQYAIVLKDSGKVIGTVNVFEDNSRAVDAMEIGYAISPDYQRRGYAFEALTALLNLLQEELMLEMVTAGVLPENEASIRLLRKLGFQPEGLRHNAVWHEGLDRPVDLQYYFRDRIGG